MSADGVEQQPPGYPCRMRLPSATGPGIALRDYGLAELTMAIDALAMRGSRVHAGIHQARKAIRRTRAMLALGESVLGPGASLIDRQLRRVNRRLSPLRDAHALVQTLERLGIKARDEPTRKLLQRARLMATRRRAALSRRPEFARALQQEQAVLVTLRAAMQGLPWESLPASMVTEAMTAAVQKAEAARQRAYAHDDAEDWHRWRRRMRRISQQHRAVMAAGLAAPTSRFDQEPDRTTRCDAGPEPAGRTLRQGLALPRLQPGAATLRRAGRGAAAQAHPLRGCAPLTRVQVLHRTRSPPASQYCSLMYLNG